MGQNGGSDNDGIVDYLRGQIGRAATSVLRWANQETRNVAAPALTPLTPGFDLDQHQVYVDHLDTALLNEGTRNIALTGRYGSGKSSVLQEFANRQRDRVLFLSLSTLGPDEADESRTNQIEKELVKQLLHRERPARLPQSRYQRIYRLSRWRAAAESTMAIAAIGIALWLFGVFPDLPGFTSDHPQWARIGALITVGVAAVCLLAGIRLAVFNRLVSEVSAGGASISLVKSDSYFDEYLDEIVYFFESMRRVEIVIFEDLDRFDDPGIFEALRELNTLLNNSKQIRASPIRFIYALRDSIFEKLGHDTISEHDDAAHAESVRANRTKFFDIVIPIVPFITHRTSRDLLAQILSKSELAPEVSVAGELIDLTARHLPDMRLLTNIRNEYVLYSTRLIMEKRGIDPLEAAKLFAMVVYKNVHLADFERVQQGRSDLDSVYLTSRRLVAESIEVRRNRLREIANTNALREILAARAGIWGDKLEWFFDKIGEGRRGNRAARGYLIAGTEFTSDEIRTDAFWKQMLDNRDGIAVQFPDPNSYPPQMSVIATEADIQRLFEDDLKIDDWESTAQADLEREVTRLQADLDTLRKADFKELASRPDFTLTDDGVQRPFADLVEENIKSEVGRALIAEGFIDRHYTLYVGQYYGNRVPLNAMTFIVHHVETNHPDFDYPFADDGEIHAVLRETKRFFLSDSSAYNIGLLDYLLEHADPGVVTVLDGITRRQTATEKAFLESYLTAGTNAAAAVAHMASNWPAIFTQLIETIDLARDKRIELVDAALAHTSTEIDYELNNAIRSYFQNTYKFFLSVSESGVRAVGIPDRDSTAGGFDEERMARNATTTMARAGFICDNLSALNGAALAHLVRTSSYTLTSDNLRSALGGPVSLSLDHIRATDTDVYTYVLEEPERYLTAIRDELTDETRGQQWTSAQSEGRIDSAASQVTGSAASRCSYRTRWTIENPDEFTAVVSDLAKHTTQQSAAVFSHAHPDCTIQSLATIPSTSWEALARCRRFPMTLNNVADYIDYVGGVDPDLASALTAAGAVAVSRAGDPADSDGLDDEISKIKRRVAAEVLQAADAIPDPAFRVALVTSLDLKEWLPATSVQPEPGPLLGLLIGERVCADDSSIFEHFGALDWETFRYAVTRSTEFQVFVTPALLGADMTAQLLSSADISDLLKKVVLRRFDEFVPTDNRRALTAAGFAALTTNSGLAANQISSIASGTADAELVLQLLERFQEDFSIEQTVNVLVSLPSPYSELMKPGSTLTFPRNLHHTSVLHRLKSEGRITMRALPKSRNKDARIEVTVL
ncbi:YobI family P-loop NTPase [Rhodococcoides yunnanense]|uniref:YobI-like P-loop NTPase domain-containing protein n=1 Tax=Rhodococcoides yunnanense TaxID=278209 RepID=A0ABU4BCJ2_9NOCA|nr:hypothetical protein [Rhodococcus yunnanensis]MDV6261918.1 hypothetical protein [Rhodococcus yunnanensis]